MVNDILDGSEENDSRFSEVGEGKSAGNVIRVGDAQEDFGQLSVRQNLGSFLTGYKRRQFIIFLVNCIVPVNEKRPNGAEPRRLGRALWLRKRTRITSLDAEGKISDSA